MRNKGDLQLLDSRDYHIAGELHFPRSEYDLKEVVVNSMQSLRILIAFIPRVRTKHQTNSNNLTCFLYLETTLLSLLKKLSNIGQSLIKKKGSVSGVCIVMEVISIVLTKLVINTIKIFMQYNVDCTISIMSLVFYANSIEFEIGVIG